MSGSNRVKFRYTGLAIAIVIAAISIVLIISIVLQKQSDLYREASRNASYYSENAKNDVTVKCVGLTGQARLVCFNEIENPARANERDEYDLYSQQAMALWTGVMGGMAVIGIALSGVGVYLIWQTWGETRKAADSATKTHDAYINIERSRLVVSAVNPKITQTQSRCRINVTNIGKSDCLVFLNGAWWSNDTTWKKGIMVAGSPKSIVVKASETVSVFQTVSTSNNERYVQGYIKYKSPIFDDHRSFFCFELEWNPSSQQAVAREYLPRGKPKDT